MPNCTECGTPGAYIGFNAVECRNPDCKYFKAGPPEASSPEVKSEGALTTKVREMQRIGRILRNNPADAAATIGWPTPSRAVLREMMGE